MEEDLVASLRWEAYTGVMSMHLKWTGIRFILFLKPFPEISQNNEDVVGATHRTIQLPHIIFKAPVVTKSSNPKSHFGFVEILT